MREIVLNTKIVDFLRKMEIECGISNDIITINRTSMCNCELCNSLDEGDSYHMILELIKEYVGSNYRVWYGGKTDDDYFLELYKI